MQGPSTLIRIILTAGVLFIIFTGIIPGGAHGHPPSEIELTYTYSTKTLNVTVTHYTLTPTIHYINRIEIYRNDGLVQEHEYDSQPTTSTFSYEYVVPAEDGDILKAIAYCSLGGDLEGEVAVIGPRSPMELTISPLVSSIDEEGERDFVVNAYSEGNPLDGVELFIIPNEGSASEVDPLSMGGYQFTYQAPDVEGDTRETINITGTRNGYHSAYLEIEFIIIDLGAIGDRILLELDPDIDELEEGGSQVFTVKATAGGEPLEGVAVGAAAAHGTIGEIEELGGGRYSFEYSAPLVEANTTETITVTASSPGFADDGAKKTFIIRDRREPLTNDGVEDDDGEVKWQVHAVLLSIGFILLALSAAVLHTSGEWKLKAHRGLGGAGAALSLSGLIYGFFMVGGVHLSSPHAILGAATALLICAALIVGQLYKKGNAGLRTPYIWIGRLALVLMLVNIFLGLNLAGVL